LADKVSIEKQKMSKISITITGISGYVGRALLPYLEKDAEIERIIGIDQLELPEQFHSDKVEFHQRDMHEVRIDDLVADTDILIHLAFMLMRLPGTSPQAAEQKNIQITRNVFEAVARQGLKKLIFTSSVVAYGIHADNPIPLRETHPLRPNPEIYYSRAKASIESYLDDFEKEHPQLIITRLRPCTVVGPQADPAQMVSFTGSTATLVKGYDPPYQLLHEEDLAQAIYLAIQKDIAGIFNVAGDEPRELSQLALSKPGGKVVRLPYGLSRFLAWLAWRTKSSVFAPEWLDLACYPLVVSNDKLKLHGWNPEFTTAEAYNNLIASVGNPRP
jgi:UDP-glucose 4-epimerase